MTEKYIKLFANDDGYQPNKKYMYDTDDKYVDLYVDGSAYEGLNTNTLEMEMMFCENSRGIAEFYNNVINVLPINCFDNQGENTGNTVQILNAKNNAGNSGVFFQGDATKFLISRGENKIRISVEITTGSSFPPGGFGSVVALFKLKEVKQEEIQEKLLSGYYRDLR